MPVPADTLTPVEAGTILDRLPPDISGYAVLAIVVWWLTRASYKDTSTASQALLDRLEARLDQTERALSAVTQDLEHSRRQEHECRRRMGALEAKYERRIAELEHEVQQLRREYSEPMAASAP